MGTRCVAARVSDDPYVYRYLFVDLYEWAGELRTVVLAKTDLFCLPEHIESYGAEIFGKLAEEHQFSGLDHETFIERLAHYLGDVSSPASSIRIVACFAEKQATHGTLASNPDRPITT